MGTKVELVGKQFSRLMVVADAKPSISRHRMILCNCECGTKEFLTRADSVRNGKTRSCGCLNQEALASITGKPKINFEGQKFARLTVLKLLPAVEGKERLKFFYLCKCECGKECKIEHDSLRSGHTKSCGCLNDEQRKININAAIDSITLYTPRISSARNVFMDHYRDGNLDFDRDFYPLSQLPCTYCNSGPSNAYDYSSSKPSRLAHGTGIALFTYNGLDRVDSNFAHNVDNVVPACVICNTAKMDQTLEVFKLYVNQMSKAIRPSIQEHHKLSLDIDTAVLDNPNRTSFRSSVWSKYSLTYNDGNLTLQQFYQLSQLPCYFCGTKPSNQYNKALFHNNYSPYAKATGNFIYSGLDRIDNFSPHTFENCVAACKYCNYAKCDLTIDQFLAWISRITAHLPTWQHPSASDLVSLARSKITSLSTTNST